MDCCHHSVGLSFNSKVRKIVPARCLQSWQVTGVTWGMSLHVPGMQFKHVAMLQWESHMTNCFIVFVVGYAEQIGRVCVGPNRSVRFVWGRIDRYGLCGTRKDRYGLCGTRTDR